MKRSTLFSILTIFLLIPLTLHLGTKIPGRWYYLTCTLVVIEVMLPFFFRFEARRPQPRELVMIAAMAALAAVSRVVFAFSPYLKAITGIIMIAGIAFGPEAGFLTGAVSAFASNFFYSQGPWTPWQMFSLGIGGFLAGIVFRRRKLCRPWLMAIFGFVCVLIVVGPILDCCTIFTMMTNIRLSSVLLVFSQGVPFNIAHGVGTALTLFFAGKPLLAKLDRLKTKYGMMS